MSPIVSSRWKEMIRLVSFLIEINIFQFFSHHWPSVKGRGLYAIIYNTWHLESILYKTPLNRNLSQQLSKDTPVDIWCNLEWFCVNVVRKKAAKGGENCLLSKLPHLPRLFLFTYRNRFLPLKIVPSALNQRNKKKIKENPRFDSVLKHWRAPVTIFKYISISINTYTEKRSRNATHL